MTAQFDVHVNLDVGRRTYPFLLVVQSRRLAHLPTRLVVPLTPASPQEARLPTVVSLQETLYVIVAHDIFPAPRRILGPVVHNLADREVQIITAIHEVISTAYG